MILIYNFIPVIAINIISICKKYLQRFVLIVSYYIGLLFFKFQNKKLVYFTVIEVNKPKYILSGCQMWFVVVEWLSYCGFFVVQVALSLTNQDRGSLLPNPFSCLSNT